MIGYDFYGYYTESTLGGGYYLESPPKTKTINGEKYLDLDDYGNLPNHNGTHTKVKPQNMNSGKEYFNSAYFKCNIAERVLRNYFKDSKVDKEEISKALNTFDPVGNMRPSRGGKSIERLMSSDLSVSKKIEFYNKYCKKIIKDNDYATTNDVLGEINSKLNNADVMKYVYSAVHHDKRSATDHVKDMHRELKKRGEPGVNVIRTRYNGIGEHNFLNRNERELIGSAAAIATGRVAVKMNPKSKMDRYNLNNNYFKTINSDKSLGSIKRRAEYKYDNKKRIEKEEAEAEAKRQREEAEKRAKEEERLEREREKQEAEEERRRAEATESRRKEEERKRKEALHREARRQMEEMEKNARERKLKAEKEMKERDAKERKKKAAVAVGIGSAAALAGGIAAYRNRKKKNNKKKSSWF